MGKTPLTRVLFGRCRKAVLLLVFGVFFLSGIITSVFTSVTPTKVEAAVNNNLNFQARLQTAAGAIVADGYYNVQFKLYDGGTAGGPAGTGAANAGTNLWTETYYDSNGATSGNDNRVRVKNGYVSVNLGSQTAFPGTIDWSQELWITMNIGGTAQVASPTWDGEMNPRLKLTGVPYAFKANQANQLQTVNGSYNSTLTLAGPTVGNQSFIIPDQGAAGTYNLLTTTAANAGYIQNGTSLQTANFNINGNGQVGGYVSATGGFRANGQTGLSATTCSGGQLLQNAIVTGGIVTGGTCVAPTTGGVTTVGTFSATSVANGASISGNTITLGVADINNPGMVSTTAQTFLGAKTFNSNVTLGANASFQMNAGTGTFTQIYNGTTGTAASFNSTNTSGTQDNIFSVSRNGAGGTTTNGLSINNTAGTLTNGLNFTGTIGTDINRYTGALSLNGGGGINLKVGGTSILQLTGSGSTLSGDLTLNNNLYASSFNSIFASNPTNAVIGSNTSSFAQSPMASTLWHDLLAFNKKSTPTFEQYNGSWSSAGLNNVLFSQKENQTNSFVDGTTYTRARWTWDNWAWSQAEWLNIGFTYSGTGQNNAVLVESSANGTTWTTRHTSTGNTFNGQAAWFKISNYDGDPYIRVTITTSGGNPLNMSSMRMLTARWGDQGMGSELQYPYDWDANQNIAFGAGALVGNGVLTIGTDTTAASGGIYFGTDTNLYRLGSGALGTGGTLTAAGTIRSNTGFNISGTAGATTTCSGGQIMQNQVVQGGIVTGGTCVAPVTGGATTVGAISGTATANGATITGNTLNLTAANGTNGGVLTNGAQTIGGAKTFNGGIVIGGTGINAGSYGITNAGAISGASGLTSTGALTITGAAASTWSTSAGALTLTSAAAATWGTAAGNLTLNAAGGTVVFGTNTSGLQKSGTAFSLDLANAANSTFSITNSLAGAASLDVDGGLNIGAGQTYKVGSTQISSANLSNDANLAKIGGTNAFTGTNSFSTQVTTTGGIANNGAGITNTGTLAGVTSVQSTAATALTIDSGTTGDLNLGTGANAKTINVGNATGGTILNVYAGTGGINLTSNAGALVKSTGANNANLYIDNTAGGNRSTMVFRDGGADKISFGKQTDNSFYAYDHTNNRDFMRVAIDGTMLLQPVGGNLGIGGTGAGYKLDVTGDVNSSTGYRVGGTAGSTATCTGGQFLQNAVIQGGIVTGGACASASAGGVTTVGAISGTSNANGATITGNTINLTAADGTNGGVVSNTTQSFVGAKTFSNGMNIATGQTYKINNIQITSAALSNDSDLAKLGTAQSFTAAKTFNAGLVIGGTGINAGGYGVTNAGAITGAGSVVAATSAALTLTANAASTWSTSAGALTLTSAAAATWGTAAGNLTLNAAGGTIIAGANTTTIQKSGTAFTIDINNASNSTLTLTNAAAGTLNLSVEGSVTAASFSGSGANVTGLNAANIGSGNLNTARLSGSYTGITGVGALTAGSINWTGGIATTGQVSNNNNTSAGFSLSTNNNNANGYGIYGFVNNNNNTNDVLRLDGSGGTVFSVKSNGNIEAAGTITTGGISGASMNVSGVVTALAVDLAGYRTSNTSATDANKWTKLATCTLVNRYDDCRAVALITSYGDGSGDGVLYRAEVDWRIKQQDVFGANPQDALQVMNTSLLDASNFSTVTISNGGPTVAELWGRINASYQAWAISPLINSGNTRSTWHSTQGFSTSLPTGTDSAFAAYANVKANSVDSSAYSYNGTAGITGSCTGGQFLQDAAIQGGIVTGGTCASASAGGVTTIGTYVNGTARTNGAAITGSTITFGSANASNAGMVDTGAQTWAGTKTLNGGLVIGGTGINGGSYGITNAGAVTASAAATWGTTSGNLTLNSAGGTLVMGANTTTIQKSGTAFTLDINNASNSTLTLTNAAAGTLSLSVEGGVTAASFTGSGAAITGLNAANIASGNVDTARISGAYVNITSVGTLTNGANIASGQTYKINGTQISSSALSNDSDIAKLSGTQTFSGAKTFSAATTINNTLNVQGNVAGNFNSTIYNSNAAGFANLQLQSDNQTWYIGTGGSTSTLPGGMYFYSPTTGNTSLYLYGNGDMETSGALYAQYGLDSWAPSGSGSPGPIGRTPRAAGIVDNTGTPYGAGTYTPAGTFTPTANTVLVAYVNGATQCTGTAGVQEVAADGSTLTISGGGLTWVPIIGRGYLNTNNNCDTMMRYFYAKVPGTPPSNMQVTVDAGAFSMDNYTVWVDEFTNVDATTPVTGAVAGARSSTADYQTFTLTLGATPTASDYKIGGINMQNQNPGANGGNSGYGLPSGWTSWYTTGATPYYAISSQVLAQTGSTSTTMNYALGDLTNPPNDTEYLGFILKNATTGGAAYSTLEIGNTNATQIYIGNSTTTDFAAMASNFSFQSTSGTSVLSINTASNAITIRGAAISSGQRLCHNQADGATSNMTIGDCVGGGADIAEYYDADGVMEPGDIVAPSTLGQYKVRATDQRYQANAMGVVTTNPVNDMYLGEELKSADRQAIAMIGRVPLKVSLENGPINIGDPLAASSTPGAAMKATASGQIIGYALENYGSSSKAVSDLVKVEEANRAKNHPELYGYHSDSSKWAPGVGKIMAFNKPGYNSPLASANSLQGSNTTPGSADGQSDPELQQQIDDAKARLGAVETSLNGLQAQVAGFGTSINTNNLRAATLTVVNATITGKLTVNNVEVTGNLQLNGHIITSGDAPTVDLLDYAGADQQPSDPDAPRYQYIAKATLAGNDIGGRLQLTIGDLPQNVEPGQLIKVKFNKTYDAIPQVLVNGQGKDSAKVQLYVDEVHKDYFIIGALGNVQPGTMYTLNYYTFQ